MSARGRAALVLVGHGSTSHPDGSAPVLALAEEIRRRDLFAEVAAVFMKQPPHLAEAERIVAAETVVVVPVFAGQGYYTDTLIPREMRLAGPVTRRDGRTFLYSAAAGTHPRIPALLSRRAETVAAAAGWPPAEAGLLLIAHGSGRPGGAGKTPRAIAQSIRELGTFAEVGLVFLEQEPFARDWPQAVAARRVVALPLLVAQGMHASRDIPPLFGLEQGSPGPVEAAGRQVVMATGLGAEPELADLVLDLAAAISACG
ncbi:MAG: CbiX/SirB N-terminal domain-containing protein [Solirubrobacterales bacterium]